MKKLSKAIIIYSIIIVVGFSVSMAYHSQFLEIISTGEYVIGFNVIRETEVKKKKKFLMLWQILRIIPKFCQKMSYQ